MLTLIIDVALFLPLMIMPYIQTLHLRAFIKPLWGLSNNKVQPRRGAGNLTKGGFASDSWYVFRFGWFDEDMGGAARSIYEHRLQKHAVAFWSRAEKIWQNLKPSWPFLRFRNILPRFGCRTKWPGVTISSSCSTTYNVRRNEFFASFDESYYVWFWHPTILNDRLATFYLAGPKFGA